MAANSADAFSVSQGRAEKINPVLLECDVPGWRVTGLGEVSDSDGKAWTTPAEVNYLDGPKAADLFNECNDVTLPNADALALDGVPVSELDADGEVISIYFFGDNYAEIFVNGSLIGVDPVPYWPFNTSVVQVRVERPFMLGVKMVDWEENLNLGSELMRGVPFHNGDGGFVAIIKDADGNVLDITDESWRVQLYYSSPLLDPSCISSSGGVRSSEACASPEKANAEEAYAVRWSVPEDWAEPGFDDSSWSQASLYTNEDIGGSLQRPAYSNFVDLFDDPEADAQFIWSANLLLDNLVLARKQIE
ncbi:MAG: hypothetical protein ABJG15_10805 [Hyphomonadaceae bacterium]